MIRNLRKAIDYRELLHSVKQIAQKQKITDTGGEDWILWLLQESMRMWWYIFFIRNGQSDRQRSFLSADCPGR